MKYIVNIILHNFSNKNGVFENLDFQKYEEWSTSDS